MISSRFLTTAHITERFGIIIAWSMLEQTGMRTYAGRNMQYILRASTICGLRASMSGLYVNIYRNGSGMKNIIMQKAPTIPTASFIAYLKAEPILSGSI